MFNSPSTSISKIGFYLYIDLNGKENINMLVILGMVEWYQKAMGWTMINKFVMIE